MVIEDIQDPCLKSCQTLLAPSDQSSQTELTMAELEQQESFLKTATAQIHDLKVKSLEISDNGLEGNDEVKKILYWVGFLCSCRYST